MSDCRRDVQVAGEYFAEHPFSVHRNVRANGKYSVSVFPLRRGCDPGRVAPLAWLGERAGLEAADGDGEEATDARERVSGRDDVEEAGLDARELLGEGLDATDEEEEEEAADVSERVHGREEAVLDARERLEVGDDDGDAI